MDNLSTLASSVALLCARLPLFGAHQAIVEPMASASFNHIASKKQDLVDDFQSRFDGQRAKVTAALKAHTGEQDKTFATALQQQRTDIRKIPIDTIAPLNKTFQARLSKLEADHSELSKRLRASEVSLDAVQSPPSPPSWVVGDHVALANLKATDFNGMVARVLGCSRERVSVEVVSTGSKIRVLPTNLAAFCGGLLSSPPPCGATTASLCSSSELRPAGACRPR